MRRSSGLSLLLLIPLLLVPSGEAGSRQGGDTMEDAVVIPALPYADTGTTVGYGDDYDYSCPYTGLSSPDVVYQYTPDVNLVVDISLCNPGTDYDTKMILYENDEDTVVDCNDDACEGPDYPNGPYLSRLYPVHLLTGNRYFIVVCGYQAETGSYALTVEAYSEHTHEVRPDGSGDFPTIQDAVDFAVDGDVIELTDGTFTGEGNRDIDCGGKPLTIRSQSGDATSCIIDCESAGRGFNFHSYETPGTVLEAITITNGSAGGAYGGGIRCGSGSPTIRDCRLVGNSARWGGGMVVGNCHPTITDCLFDRNTAEFSGGGLYCGLGECGAIVTRSFFVDNEAGLRGGGIYCDGFPSPWFEDCTIFHNVATLAGGGLYCSVAHPHLIGSTIVKNSVADPVEGIGGGIATYTMSHVILENTIVAYNFAEQTGGVSVWEATVSCCDVYGNANGNWDGIEDPTGLDGNISADPLFCDFDGGDLTLDLASPCMPFTPPNEECDLIGAWPAACPAAGIATPPGLTRCILSVTPNPSYGGFRIAIGGASWDGITASIFDVSGREVRRLQSGGIARTARRTLEWNGCDGEGIRLPAGIYFVRATASDWSDSRPIVLIR